MSRRFPFSTKLFSWVDYKRQAQALALQAEASVRQLSNLPSQQSNTASNDIVTVLKSTCLLLERLVEERNTVVGDRHETFQAEVQNPAPSTIQPAIAQPAPAEQLLVSPPLPETEPELILSTVAKELIKLRDWVLLAQTGGTAVAPEVLQELYRKLGRVLEKDGVIPLEDSGSFNYERQQVVDTKVTNSPTQDDLVCSTVRPGYLFHEKLVRPQEVIVFTFDDSAHPPNTDASAP